MSKFQDNSVLSPQIVSSIMKNLEKNGLITRRVHDNSVDIEIKKIQQWTNMSANDRFGVAVARAANRDPQKTLNRSSKQVKRYTQGGEIPLSVVTSVAEAADVPVEWIATGSVDGIENRERADKYAQIPRFDARLAAGSGHWNEDNVTLLDHIPFTREFLLKKLDRKSTRDLLILEASGDSMLPTMADGDLVLVDKRATARSDGIFAYVQDGLARVKRFRFLASGKVEVVSDNREIYPPETLDQADLEQLSIIGRVRWIGHTV